MEPKKQPYFKYSPKMQFWESIIQWATLKNLKIINNINKKSFNVRCMKNPDLKVNWIDEEAVRVITIGQSHIDAAWLWRKEDCRRKKIPVTFSRALYHMDVYPNTPFTFTSNYPVYYKWMRDDCPEIWDGILERVKEGRWEVTDGAWVENDVNIPNGESLIRQRLLGQHFYLEEFGFISDIAWADDVFGFPHQLPQILAKCNARYFLTNKFCYNDTNKWPYHTLLWRAPDGSDVLLAWNQHKNNWHNYLKTFKELSVMVKDGEEPPVLNYMSDFNEAKKKYSEDFLPYTVGVYGAGDGGNGPRPGEIAEQLSWDQQKLVKMMTMKECFETLEPYRNKVPIWDDELYLENHRGCLTSISMIKANNKTSEVLFHSIEYLNVLNILTGGKNFQPEISELWKPMLFLQFHDILPGSSIPEVYRDAAVDYETIFKRVFEIKDEINKNLNQQNNANDSNSLLKFIIRNNLSWERDGIISICISDLISEKIDNEKQYIFKVSDEEGTNYLCQIFKIPYYGVNKEYSAGLLDVIGKDYLRKIDQYDELLEYNYPSLEKQYLWIKIPSNKKIEGFGNRIINISHEIKDLTKNQPEKIYINSENKTIPLENENIKLKIESNTAKIFSVSDESAGISENVIDQIVPIQYLDIEENKSRNEDAWNIYTKYLQNPIDLPQIEYYEIESDENNGDLIKSILFKTKKTEKGTIYFYRIYILKDCPLIHYDISVNNHDDHKMLKFRTAPIFPSDEMISGAQYGSIKRITLPRNRFNNYDVKFEYPNQQWDIVNGTVNGKDYQVTLLNRNKYGIFAQGSSMELTLLRSSRFRKWTNAATLDDDDPRPPFTDLGFHTFSMAIKITKIQSSHNFGWSDGYEFNYPFISLKYLDSNKLSGLNNESLISIKNKEELPNISIGAIKSIENLPEKNNPHPEWFCKNSNDKNWILLRIAEYYGKESQIHLKINSAIKLMDVKELDMLERILEEINIKTQEFKSNNNEFSFTIKPYEIKSIALKLKKI